MHVLIVKTSSLGDIVHTFPAISDAAVAIPNFTCDWVVEEAFAELPTWHPAVRRVIPIGLRRWRRTWFNKITRHEIKTAITTLRAANYDLVIDAQGLIKSAIITNIAAGASAGYDSNSARESLASWGYRQNITVAKTLHAIERIRRLCALALNYPIPTTLPHYGLNVQHHKTNDAPYVLLIPATTWPSKHWPLAHWADTARLATNAGYRTLLPWHTAQENQQATNIIKLAGCGELLPRQNLTSLAQWLATAVGVIGVDTGLIHIAAALGTPTVVLYGPTSSALTGPVQTPQHNLASQIPCRPCYRRQCLLPQKTPQRPANCLAALEPLLVWEHLCEAIKYHTHRSPN